MNDDTSVKTLLDVAQRMMAEAKTAFLVTLDETGCPASRVVNPFAPEADFARIVVPTHPASRKTRHIEGDPRVVLSYLDGPNQGYVTLVGRAELSDDLEERKAHWLGWFTVFWPDGPESDGYRLLLVAPERIELRSFKLGVAGDPTHWSPVILARDDAGHWQRRD
jgi:general stress protein 26